MWIVIIIAFLLIIASCMVSKVETPNKPHKEKIEEFKPPYLRKYNQTQHKKKWPYSE